MSSFLLSRSKDRCRAYAGPTVVVVLTVEEQTEKCEEQIEFLTKKKRVCTAVARKCYLSKKVNGRRQGLREV